VPIAVAVALAALVPLLLGAPALALAPGDVTVQRLGDLPFPQRQSSFDFVLRELAMAVSPPPDFAVHSLGLLEFEVSSEHRVAFIHGDPAPGSDESPWDAVAEDGTQGEILWMPGFRFRKGLPASIEVGGDFSWLTGSRQFLLGGYGRWVVQDGWEKVPDAAIQLGYRGYVGNDQLKAGVFEMDLSVGYSFRRASSKERPGSRFSPFAGYGYLMAHGRPGAVTVDGVGPGTGWAKDAQPGVDARDFRFHRFFGGLEVATGQVAFRASADVTVPRGGKAVAATNFSLAVGL
jgi:hypothetical protein